MKHKFYGKNYIQVYKPIPLQSLHELDDRVNEPELFVEVEYVDAGDELIHGVDLFPKIIRDRITIDNVICLIEHVTVGDDAVNYYTNYTCNVSIPNESKYQEAVDKVLNEVKNIKNNNDFSDRLKEGLRSKVKQFSR